MTEDVKNSKKNEAAELQSKQFKFMANALHGPQHQTENVDWLKKFTPDTQISYNRFLIAMVTACGVGVVALSQLMSIKGAYIGIWVLTILFSLLTLIFIFILPARGRSMLEVALTTLIAWWQGKNAIKVGRKSNLKTVGIYAFDNKTGVATMMDRDYAVFFDVEGSLSLSTLPNVADLVATYTAQYNVARSASSQQESIISITRVDVETYLKNMQKIYEQANTDSYRDIWTQYMSQLQMQYVDEQISQEYTVRQVIMIRDEDLMSLKRTLENFEQSVNMGMFASVQRIKTDKELVKLLAPLTALAKGEVAKYGR